MSNDPITALKLRQLKARQAAARQKAQNPDQPQEDGSTVAPYNPSLFERAMTGLRQSGIVPRANIRDFESIGAGVRSAADTAAFGFGDELIAAGNTATGIGGDFGDFSANLANQAARSKAARVHHPTASTVGDVAGLAGGVAGIGKAGLSLAANASTPGKVIAGSTGDGVLYGGLAGFGHTDGGAEERVKGAGVGAGIGACEIWCHLATHSENIRPPILVGSGHPGINLAFTS